MDCIRRAQHGPVSFDVEFCRAHFPQLSNGWLYLDNAGGSYVPEAVIQASLSFLRESKNQPYPHFKSGKLADTRIEAAYSAMAALINAEPSEIVIGPSTTTNLYVLAQAIRPSLSPGDEVIVTNQDHESNIGPWMRLAEFGVKIVVWGIDPQTGSLDLHQLRRLLNARTKIVAFTHVSNIVADINPVAEISAIAHAVGAKVVVDGVAFAAHALIDVKAWDVDFYAFSLYKTYGPHQAVLYGKRSAIKACSGQNHYFYEHDVPLKLHPTGNQYELVGATVGIEHYLTAVHEHHFTGQGGGLRDRARDVFGLFEQQENALATKLMSYLVSRNDIRIIGSHTGDRIKRMPTIAFSPINLTSEALADALSLRKIAVAYGSFYSRRCLEALNIVDMETGVVRISLLHYNTMTEIDQLIVALTEILGGPAGQPMPL